MALDLRLDGREFDSRPPRLVLGLVTVFGQINHLGISPSRYRPTQPPTLRRTGSEYLPKCGDALQLASKGWFISLVDKRVLWEARKTVRALVNTRKPGFDLRNVWYRGRIQNTED